MTKLEAYQKRLSNVQKSIPASQLWLFGSPSLIQYLSGFEFLVPNEREAFLVLGHSSAHLMCGGFTPNAVLSFLHELNITPMAHTHKVLEHTRKIMTDTNAKELLIDVAGITARELIELTPLLPTPQLSVDIPNVPTKTIHNMRVQKDAYEQECIQKAGVLIKDVMTTVISQLRSGMTEIEVKATLEFELQKAGSLKPAFPTIVAFGEHAFEPHYQPASTVLEPGMPVLIDAGAVVDGYCSDMTRTVWFEGNKGKKSIPPSKTFEQVERLVKESYAAAVTKLNTATTDVTAAQLDRASRDIFAKNDVDTYFIHTLGHGVGLEIHEPPSIGNGDHTILTPGMAITIEPGLYLPIGTLPKQDKAIGYRYENTCLITDSGVIECT